jgi:hypothetical protein
MKNSDAIAEDQTGQLLADVQLIDLNPSLRITARKYKEGKSSDRKRKELQKKLEEQVTGRIGDAGTLITDRLFELIDGAYVIQRMDGKQIRFYKTPPNLKAIMYALDRVLGHPTQPIEQNTSDKAGINTIEMIIKNLASRPYHPTSANSANQNPG